MNRAWPFMTFWCVVFLAGLTAFGSPAYSASLPGDPALLEPQGTTLVSQTAEKILYTYSIRPGDTLWDIAKWALQNPFLWPEFLKYNFIENPNLIFPGDRLTVPDPETLLRVREAQDVDEIQAIRQEAEANAVSVELEPPPGLEGTEIFPGTEEVRMPVVDADAGSLAANDLKITGRKTVTFDYREYRGGTTPNYFSSGYTRRETLSLNLAGQVMERVKLEGDFYQSDQELENRYSLKLFSDQWELFLGDFAANLPDTEFLLESREVSGGRGMADLEIAGATVLAGAAK